MRLREVWPFAVVIVLSAFLLFQVQLIIGKYILPWFGGTPSVWTTCMLVFQVLLLLGYIYSHLLAGRLPMRFQARLHLSLLGLSVLIMIILAFVWSSPITPGPSWKPSGKGDPIMSIVTLLTVAVGLPFFLLATTSPLLQDWVARTTERSPYRLFALSNLGSLLGLLSYPFLLEPALTLQQQARLWSWGYGAYAALGAVCVVLVLRRNDGESGRLAADSAAPVSEQAGPGMALHLIWMLLAACGCVMFLATTNMLCQEIAVIPFLWVLPLSLYLITFIASFASSRWYRRGLFHPLYAVSAVLLLLAQRNKVMPQIICFSLALLVVGMICHGELARLKPASRHLTGFYLMIALGGAVGGVAVAVIAPHLFSGFWEFQAAFIGCGVLLFGALLRDRDSWLRRGPRWVPAALVAGVAVAVAGGGWLRPALYSYLPGERYLMLILLGAGLPAAWAAIGPGRTARSVRWTQAYCVGVIALIGVALGVQMHAEIKGSFYRFRSFFGSFRVERQDKALILRHGETMHGWQIRDGVHDPTPTAYYATNTGIGALLWYHPKRQAVTGEAQYLRVGIVGLGTGTLAAYGRANDYYCFYEIDPAIAWISHGPQALFTYLKNSAARVEVVMGDGRLSLEREAAGGKLQKFDVLVLDAFSSDSIPVHLLTREAMELYLRHLRDEDSVVAFHISNRILDLSPILKGLAKEFNLTLKLFNTVGKGPITASTRWGLLSRNPDAFQKNPKLASRSAPPSSKGHLSILWTDDFSNLFQIIEPQAWW